MNGACRTCRTLVAGWIVLWTMTGCQGLNEIKLPGLTTASELREGQRQEDKYRRKFRESGSPVAIRWLLSRRIRTGMTLPNVSKIIGQDGERVYDDARFKANSGQYRASDETYSWGPDEEGHSIYLFFRDGRLTNFNPHEFDAN